MFETQNLFLQQEENTMNAIENRKMAITAQENAIRKKLDQLANLGITQYEFPDGIILDEVATSLTADGYDVERWFFDDPRECFSMVHFDDFANGHLYDFFENDCDCECGCDCNDDCECDSGCHDTCKCSCGNNNDCEHGSGCHDTCKCNCGNNDDCECGSGCNYECCNESLYDYLSNDD